MTRRDRASGGPTPPRTARSRDDAPRELRTRRSYVARARLKAPLSRLRDVSSRQRRRREPEPRKRLISRPVVAAVAIALGLAAIAAVFVLTRKPAPPAPPASMSTVNTQDVHSLAFLGSSERIVLGHHGGILESVDGGSTWTPWGTGSDAMALGIAGDQPIIVAGHNVLAIGRPDGRWQDIANDLPNTDIHGFARDPHDANHVWAYLAQGGLYESLDGGATWTHVFGGHTFGLFAVPRGDVMRLIAVDPERGAIVASDDAGRSWQAVSTPPSTPVYAMAGTAGGETILFSGSAGLFRSDDGGQTFAPLVDVGQPILAVAVTDDGNTIVFATSDRAIYRSDDGGRTWPGR